LEDSVELTKLALYDVKDAYCIIIVYYVSKVYFFALILCCHLLGNRLRACAAFFPQIM